MKTILMVGMVAVACSTGWARTNYINNAVSDWTRADSYSDTSFVPGVNDVVVIPADTTVTLDASKDAASLALVNSLERIVTATPTSRIEINVDEGDEKEVAKSISGYKYSDAGSSGMDYTRGPIVKIGKGRLILSSADYFDVKGLVPWHYVVYDYYTQIIVSGGTLRLLPTYAREGFPDHNNAATGRVTVEEGATLELPYVRSDYGGTVQFKALSGSGTVINPDGRSGVTVDFTGSRSNGDAATFEGILKGSVYVMLNQSASYDSQVLTGASEFSTQVIVGKGQRTGIGSFGNGGSSSPLGTYELVSFDKDSGILEYVGEGETSSRPFLFSATDVTTSCHPTVIDAGANGGVTFTGQWQRHYQGNSGQSVVLTGSNTAECVLANNLNDNANTDDATGRGHTLYLRKEGTGVWRMKDTGANRQNFTSGISVDEGTLRYESIDQVGKACSLGLATHLTDGAIGTDDASAHGVDYAIRLGAETYLGQKKTESACLEYVGSQNGASTDRKIALAGTGCLRVTGTGTVKLGPVCGLGSGKKTLVLDGSNTGRNAVIDVTDGADGGVVSMVKRGSGKWYLGGQQSFSGELSIEGGELVANKSANYSWYRWVLTELRSGGGWVSVQEFALFDDNGKRQNKGLTYNASPVRSASCNGSFVELERGTCAFGDGKNYTITSTYDPSMMFDHERTSAGANFSAGVAVSPANSSSWITITMRLAADATPVTGYDVMWIQGDWNQGKDMAKSMYLEGSRDGLSWDRLSTVGDVPTIWDGNVWIAGSNSGFGETHWVTNKLFKPIASAPVMQPNILGNVSKVTVKGGGKLTVEEGKIAIDSLVIGKDGGTLDGVSFAESGTLALEDVPESRETRDFEVPLTFAHAEGIEDLPSWTATVNGKVRTTKKVVLVNGKLHVVSTGLVIIFK